MRAPAFACLAAFALAASGCAAPADTSSSMSASGSAAPAVALDPVTITGKAQLACPQCTEVGANMGAGYRGGQSGLDSYFVTVGPEVGKRAFKLTSTGGDPNVSFRDSCTEGTPIGDPFAGAGPEEGTVPAGTACVLLWESQMPDSTFTLVIT